MDRQYYVYILTNALRTTLYIGVTSALERRVWQHKTGAADGFTKRYRLHQLVYWEETTDVWAALEREKQIKRWRREKKVALINRMNPEWRDLSADWYEPMSAQDVSARVAKPRRQISPLRPLPADSGRNDR
jgi:putative endonuclease